MTLFVFALYFIYRAFDLAQAAYTIMRFEDAFSRSLGMSMIWALVQFDLGSGCLLAMLSAYLVGTFHFIRRGITTT